MKTGVEMLPVDRRAACEYYGYDDEKDLTYWGGASQHRDVERLAEAFARHRLNTHPAASGSVREPIDTGEECPVCHAVFAIWPSANKLVCHCQTHPWFPAAPTPDAAASEAGELGAFILGYASMPGDQWRERWPEWAAQVDNARARFRTECPHFAQGGKRNWARSSPRVETESDAVFQWVFVPLLQAALTTQGGAEG